MDNDGDNLIDTLGDATHLPDPGCVVPFDPHESAA